MTKILGNFEQETIITFNKGEDMACIFTYERTWQRQIEQKLGIQPTFNNGCGGKEYHVPKKRIRMPQSKRVYSPEQKQKMAKRLAARRPQKSIISAQNTAAVGLSAAKKSRGANNTSHAKSKAK